MIAKTAPLSSQDLTELDSAVLRIVQLRNAHPDGFASAGGRVGKRIHDEIARLNATKSAKGQRMNEFREEAKLIALGTASDDREEAFHKKYENLDPEVMVRVLRGYNKVRGDLAVTAADLPGRLRASPAPPGFPLVRIGTEA